MTTLSQREKSLALMLRLIAIGLWTFTVKVIFIVTLLILKSPFAADDGPLAGNIMRAPYRWDFETMFAGIHLVWGIFLWRAAKNPKEHISLIQFTMWTNIVHGVIMFIQAILRPFETIHLLADTVLLLGSGMLLALLYANIKTTSQSKSQLTT